MAEFKKTLKKNLRLTLVSGIAILAGWIGHQVGFDDGLRAHEEGRAMAHHNQD